MCPDPWDLGCHRTRIQGWIWRSRVCWTDDLLLQCTQDVHNDATTWHSFTFPMTTPLQIFCIPPFSLLALLFIDAYENVVIGLFVNSLIFLFCSFDGRILGRHARDSLPPREHEAFLHRGAAPSSIPDHNRSRSRHLSLCPSLRCKCSCARFGRVDMILMDPRL